MPNRPARAGVRAAAILLCSLAAAAGCATGAAQPAGSGGQPGSASASAPGGSSPGAAGSAPAGSAGSDVTLAFAGDVHFTGRTTKLLRNPATAFGPISPLLRSADLTLVNLETAVTSGGQPQPKYYHFRTRPAAFTALRDAGIDVANMANNHVLDYGRVGLADTMAAARAAHFPVLGIGANATAAWKPYLVTIKGVRIAFLGVSQVAELASSWVATDTRSGEANSINLHRTLAAVRAAKKIADVVVVVMHWGTEGQACPDANQLSLAPKLAAAGASIIVGSHAHILQGSGWLGHTFVAYGMANFLWWETSYSTDTGVLLLTLHGHRLAHVRFVPAMVSGTGQPIVDTGRAARLALVHYRSLRACAQLSARPGP
jgi:poly-gamma-glutamate capsule biosynthesis protein CapA/YwtB (metallophosphatase superfamily)